jgi:SAM-dependent methyltransferase
LGCGAWENSVCLSQLYPDALIIGLDYDFRALRTAQGIRILGDIQHIPFAGGQFDLILIRHPDVHRHPSSWQHALSASEDALRIGGRLVITVYSAAEYALIQKWRPPILTECAVPIAALTAPDGVGRDRFVLLYAKGI